jgi:hypothetical protein
MLVVSARVGRMIENFIVAWAELLAGVGIYVDFRGGEWRREKEKEAPLPLLIPEDSVGPYFQLPWHRLFLDGAADRIYGQNHPYSKRAAWQNRHWVRLPTAWTK